MTEIFVKEPTDPMLPPALDLLTVAQAAAFLHVSSSTIRSYLRSGDLKAFRIAGKRKVLIPRDAVLALLQPMTDA